jgi:hypothetical protein
MNIKIFGISDSPHSVISLFFKVPDRFWPRSLSVHVRSLIPNSLYEHYWWPWVLSVLCLHISMVLGRWQIWNDVDGVFVRNLLTALTVSQTVAHGAHYSVIVTGRKLSWPNLWRCYEIILKGMRQITKHLIQDRRCSAGIREKWEATPLVATRLVCVCGTVRSGGGTRHVVHWFTFIFTQFGKGKSHWRHRVLCRCYSSVSNRLYSFL